MSDNSLQSRWINLRNPPFNNKRLLIIYITMFAAYVLKQRGSNVMLRARTRRLLCRILGSHGVERKHSCLLCCSAVYSSGSLPPFLRY
jgi:hypothetical protein